MGLFPTCTQNKFLILCKRKILTLSQLISFQDLSTYRKPLNFLEVHLSPLDVQMTGGGIQSIAYSLLAKLQLASTSLGMFCELLEWAGLFGILLRESRWRTTWALGGAIMFHTAVKLYHKGELSSLAYKYKPVLFQVGDCCTKSGQSLYTAWPELCLKLLPRLALVPD